MNERIFFKYSSHYFNNPKLGCLYFKTSKKLDDML